MYLYKTTIYKIGANVIGATPSQSDIDDFEGTPDNTALLVNEVIVTETTFVIELTYAQFKTKITSPIAWVDVKYTSDESKYVLYLASDIAL